MITGENQEEVSLDDEHIRIRRAIHQHEFYFDSTKPNYIAKTYGHPVTQRWSEVREAIIPPDEFPLITGQEANSQSIMTRSIDNGAEDYPDLRLTAKELFPNLCKTIDECEDTIETFSASEKAEAGRRLATVLLVLGITIHPSIDGNGQTFKCLTLSYLHQLDPSLRDNFFPIKYSQLLMKQDRDLTLRFKGIIADLDLPDIPAQSEEDQKIVDFMEELNNLRYANMTSEVRNEKMATFFAEQASVLQQIGIQEVTRNEEWKNFDLEPVSNALGRYLIKKGYNRLLVIKLVHGFGHKNDNTTYALQVILKEPDRKYLRQYIETGHVELPVDLDKDSQKIWETLLDIFAKQETDMIDLLSRNNGDEIQKQYAGALNYAPIAEARRTVPYRERDAFEKTIPAREILERKRSR
jgi:hypothetical protein